MEMYLSVTLMVLFLVVAFFPVRDFLESKLYMLMADRRANRRCFHRLEARALKLAVRVLDLYMYAMSTLLVIIIFKNTALAFDCVHADRNDVDHWAILKAILLGHKVQEDVKPYVAQDPKTFCFEGRHRQLCLLLGVLTPAFMVALIPYATVGGDSRYTSAFKVRRGIGQIFERILCGLPCGDRRRARPAGGSRHLWVQSARRKATVLNLGFCNPDPEHVYMGQCVELFAKVTLPVVVILTTTYPRVQAVGVTAVGAVLALDALLHPPLQDRGFGRLDQGLSMLTFHTMLCGLATAFVEEDAWWPVAACVAGWVVYAIGGLRLLLVTDLAPQTVQRWSTDRPPAAQLREAGCATVHRAAAELLHGLARLKTGFKAGLKGAASAAT